MELNVFVIIGALWLAGAFFACALVHGAEKLRREPAAPSVFTFGTAEALVARIEDQVAGTTSRPRSPSRH